MNFVNETKSIHKSDKETLTKISGGGLHKCPKCDMKFPVGRLQRHIEINKNNNQPNNCDLCHFISCSIVGLKIHKIKFHQSLKKHEKKISCNNCDQKFYNNSDKQSHIQKFDGIIKTCNQCEYKSCNIWGLSIHKKNIHNNFSKYQKKNLGQYQRFDNLKSEQALGYLSQKEIQCKTQKSEFQNDSNQSPITRNVLTRPKKGQWIVQLERMNDLNDYVLDYVPVVKGN